MQGRKLEVCQSPLWKVSILLIRVILLNLGLLGILSKSLEEYSLQRFVSLLNESIHRYPPDTTSVKLILGNFEHYI